MYTIDRPFEMTSFSVKDILNLPEAGLCSSKSETTHESSPNYHSPGGNTRTSSCGSVVCNQGQGCSYTSKNELDFVSLIERKVNAGLHEALNLIAGKTLAAIFERVSPISCARRAAEIFRTQIIFFSGKLKHNGVFYEAITDTTENTAAVSPNFYCQYYYITWCLEGSLLETSWKD